MKRVEVLVPPAQFEELKDALADIGVDSMTVAEVKHVDPTCHRREVFRGTAYHVDFVLRVRVDLVVHDPIVPRILDVLTKTLDRPRAEPTKVVVSEVTEVVRMPTEGRLEPRRAPYARAAS